MTDFADFSSNNLAPDLRAYRAGGAHVIALKATEGVTYAWDQGSVIADQARALGLTVVRYHFARPGSSGAAQASYFKAHASADDIPCLDLEGGGWAAGEAAKVSNDFCHALGAGIFYSGASFLQSNAVPYPDGWHWWQPAYGVSAPPAPPNLWPAPWAWQYTETGHLPGMNGDGDVSHLYGADNPLAVPAPEKQHIYQRFHTKDRDTWNTLARLLGAPAQAEHLYRLNPGVLGADGQRTDNPNRYLRGGQPVVVDFPSRVINR